MKPDFRFRISVLNNRLWSGQEFRIVRIYEQYLMKILVRNTSEIAWWWSHMSCPTRLRSQIKPYLTFFSIKKKQNGKMVVTFLKLNIFWYVFFLTISTIPETHESGLHHARETRRSEGYVIEVVYEICPNHLKFEKIHSFQIENQFSVVRNHWCFPGLFISCVSIISECFPVWFQPFAWFCVFAFSEIWS